MTMHNNLKRIGRSELDEDPHVVWNTFVEILALSDYSDLDQPQRPAYLVFWYESEVLNGGHLQYFTNKGIDHISETIKSLREFGADAYADVLEEAIGR